MLSPFLGSRHPGGHKSCASTDSLHTLIGMICWTTSGRSPRHRRKCLSSMVKRNRLCRWQPPSRVSTLVSRLWCQNKVLFMNSPNLIRRLSYLPYLELVLIACLCAGCVATARAEVGSDRPSEQRMRARDLDLITGQYQPGPLNAITDVAGVKVGHTTLIKGDGPLKAGNGPVRTGVTVIIPRDDVWHKKVPAGSFVLNGTGEMTGLSWVAESGFLEYPVALTNTLNVPRVANGIMSWVIRQYPEIGITDDTLTPVVAECDDGRLNDIQGRHVSEADVVKALDGASSGPVPEGTIGAGTGMVSYGFKGGIGTASRRLSEKDGGYTLGVLVNVNHGRRPELIVSGIPVGRSYDAQTATAPIVEQGQSEGSIIIVVATDAPLDGRQLSRLA